VIIGEDEVKSKTVVLRNMDKAEQETIPMDRITEVLL
jgi:histidyl-tRNA synthetase